MSSIEINGKNTSFANSPTNPSPPCTIQRPKKSWVSGTITRHSMKFSQLKEKQLKAKQLKAKQLKGGVWGGSQGGSPGGSPYYENRRAMFTTSGLAVADA